MIKHQTENDLLAALSDAEWGHVRPALEPVTLRQGEVVAHAEETLHHVYFPTAGVVSNIASFENGETVEVAQVGTDGLVDVGAVLGGRNAIGRHVVQIAGSALRMEAKAFRRWQERTPRVHGILSRYARAFMTQTLQISACNALHSVDQRVARWLLMSDDISGRAPIALTQQSVGDMLGTSRAAVSAVARKFQRAGLIRYSRGMITILDRDALMRASCECYQAIRARHAGGSVPRGPAEHGDRN
ncbi:MAG TPA: Crp/Fnr family transcriptional regulator [Rhodopila sp.]|uniref:Crp/Fnr family transcriptional regulator n=1 Tax=Rhodopila sp. TaxID=2480087 RepID=UPI002D1BDA18|nr:Crp/Fnr family transcriptional regulator [Rhodopila sp.]HVY17170.1 Crp/Fnr family transcriptional regulator [Rhodopila sp.]